MKTKIFAIVAIVTISLFLLPSLVQAQPIFGDDVNDVPLDGGLSILLAAGIGYGAKMVKDKKHKQTL